MNLKQRLTHELKSVGLAMFYFGAWLGALLLIKQLVLAEYDIAFRGWSRVLVGVLILSKVVLVLEHVPLGAWVRARPAWVNVLVRTALYSAGVAVVLVLERGFDARHEHGGFGPAVVAIFQETDRHQVWANTIVISGALLGHNVLSVIRRHLGQGALLRMFLSPLPATPRATHPPSPARPSH